LAKKFLILAASDQDRKDWIDAIIMGAKQLDSKVSKQMVAEENELSKEFQEIVYEGWLTKRGRKLKNFQRRWVILSNTHLSYYSQPPKTSKDFVNCKKVLPLARAYFLKKINLVSLLKKIINLYLVLV